MLFRLKRKKKKERMIQLVSKGAGPREGSKPLIIHSRGNMLDVPNNQ